MTKAKPVKTIPRPAWQILDEPDLEAAQSRALCRCVAGHLQLIAIDVRPPPACLECARAARRYKRQHAAKS